MINLLHTLTDTTLAFALADLQAGEIVVADTDATRTNALVGDLRAAGVNARCASGDTVAEMRAADGLVNATPLGMYQYPGNPFPAAGMGGQRWVFDAVYTPEWTASLLAARASGLETMTGFQLFFHQGLDAFERFSDERVDVRDALAAFLGRHPSGGSE